MSTRGKIGVRTTMSSDISIRRIRSPSQIGAEYTNNKVGVVTGSSLSGYQKKDVWAQAYDNGSVGRVSSWEFPLGQN
jgi:hypothetical protein